LIPDDLISQPAFRHQSTTIAITMFASRLATRNASRFAAQLRAPAQRRLASTSAENEFIKERQHIKEHAKETTGECH
jgi:hypothetical protein